MRSKRSPYFVITDDNIKLEMHFFSDGTNGSIIHCKASDLRKLAKELEKKIKVCKKNKKLKKLGHLGFIHLNPEISFFISDK